MASTSRLLRPLETLLGVLGISLLGFVAGDMLLRWNYQTEQERALERGPAISVKTNDHVSAAKAKGAAGGAEADLLELLRYDTMSPLERAATRPPRIEEQRPAIPSDANAFDSDALGRIEIPRIGIAAIVKEGADDGTLDIAVGRVPGTARPGELGNMVLAGHRDTFFRPLRRIKLNDRIRMIVPPNTYEYRVRSLRVVAPEETSVLSSSGVEELTLVTCYPFRFIGSAPERFIVRAARVN